MKRAGVALVLIAIGGLSLGAGNMQQATTSAALPALRSVQKLRDNLYFVSGGDTYERNDLDGGQYADIRHRHRRRAGRHDVAGRGSGPPGSVKSVTSKPVTTIINTHTHYDHSGSNTEFPSTVEFVAHENTRANMAKPSCPPVTNCAAFKGDNAKYLPKRTYKDRLSLFSGKDQVDLYYFGRGTPTATPSWSSRRSAPCTPAICSRARTCRSSTSRTTAAARSNSARRCSRRCRQSRTSTLVIGGHTPSPVAWNDFRTYTDFYSEFLTSAQAAIKRGTSVDEFVKSYRVPDKYPGFQADPARVKANAEAIWSESRK